MLRLALFIAALAVFVYAQGGHHHEFRKYSCVKRKSGNGTDCTLELRKKKGDEKVFHANANQGCFEESSKEGTRVYCPLFCPETVDAYNVAKTPQNNHKCINLGNFKSEKRSDEWFMWRSGACIEQEMSFEYGCHFVYPIEKADVQSFFAKKRS